MSVPSRTATVVWFNEPKGFGFLRDESSGQDVYVHFSAVDRPGFRTLHVGEKVAWEPADSPDGLKAALVRPLPSPSS